MIVNVQRGGPGLGGLSPSQSDYFQATKGGGHGDYHLIVLHRLLYKSSMTWSAMHLI